MAVRPVRTSSPAPRLAGGAAAAVLAGAVVVAGIWVAGGVLTDDFRLSMALTAAWFALVVAGAVLAWRRAPALRPAAVVAVATFVAVGGYLGYTSTVDTTVNEVVASGPVSLEGSFASLAHPTEGTARVVEEADGSRVLTLTGFRTDPGPDLYVYVVPGAAPDGDVDGGTQLARLKGNVGSQQYALPAELRLGDAATVVVWCRAFSVAFGAAALAAV
jgi:hypothetical protein